MASTKKIAKKADKPVAKSAAKGKKSAQSKSIHFTRPADGGNKTQPVGVMWEKSKLPSFYVIEVDPVAIAKLIKAISADLHD